MGKFHTSQEHSFIDYVRPELERRRLGDDNRPDYEQCCFCGEPATCWPTYSLGRIEPLGLDEQAVFAMCGICFEEAEELKAKKGRSYEHHMMLCNGGDRS